MGQHRLTWCRWDIIFGVQFHFGTKSQTRASTFVDCGYTTGCPCLPRSWHGHSVVRSQRFDDAMPTPCTRNTAYVYILVYKEVGITNCRKAALCCKNLLL